MKTKLLLIFLLLSAAQLQAEEPDVYNLFKEANTLYAESNFFEAEQNYRQILDAGYSAPELYYNLANACYRQQKYTDAIYYYEKAALLKPRDKDIRHNLEFAKLSIHKQIQETSDLFFVRIYKNIVNSCSADCWAKISIAAFIISLALILFYLFSRVRRQKIISFTFATVFLAGSLISFIFSSKRLNLETGNSQAIIYTEAVPLRSSPNETATILIRISAGHKVGIQEYSGDWAEVELGNGQIGWLEKEAFKVL
jgi:tetratricopeptide (TPR) repeat protein